MNIAIITPYKNNYGGVEVVNQILINIFEENGNKVDIISLDDIGELNNNILLKRIIKKPYITSHIFKKIKKKYDIVICNGEFSYGIKHPKCINLFHGSDYGIKMYSSDFLSVKEKIDLIRNSYIQKIGAKGKYVVAVSDFIKNILENQGIKVNKVINNAIDIQLFKPNEGIERKHEYLFVGSHSYYEKGFDILEKISDNGFIINCVTNQDPGKKLNWIKNVDNSLMPNIYNKHRMLVFPSRFEAAGLVPIEAMACGVPVIMNAVGYGHKLKEHIPEFVVDDWDDIKEYINRIKVINQNYRYYSKIAREYVIQNHSFEIFKNEWLKLTEDIYEDRLEYR